MLSLVSVIDDTLVASNALSSNGLLGFDDADTALSYLGGGKVSFLGGSDNSIFPEDSDDSDSGRASPVDSSDAGMCGGARTDENTVSVGDDGCWSNTGGCCDTVRNCNDTILGCDGVGGLDDNSACVGRLILLHLSFPHIRSR